MDVESIRNGLGKISVVMDENKDYLIELDQQNGDGDLGLSMSAGFNAAWKYAENSEEKDLGKFLMAVGKTFNESAPSSLGTILSLGFMGMAKVLKGKTEVSFAELAEAMDAGVKQIMARAGSKEGEKTILDAFCPAVHVLLEEKDDETVAFEKAARAAAEGAEATRGMRSVHGRAAYYGEKSIGVIDGGAVAGSLIFKALSAR